MGHLRSLLWGHLRQPGLSFPALSLRCGSLPARVIAETATQEMDDSTAQFPKKHTTYFLHSFFFFLQMGSGVGTCWQPGLASSAKKIKTEVRYAERLTLRHLSLDQALSRRHPPPCRASEPGSRVCLAGLNANAASALPRGARPHFFFPLPNLSCLECERRN